MTAEQAEAALTAPWTHKLVGQVIDATKGRDPVDVVADLELALAIYRATHADLIGGAS